MAEAFDEHYLRNVTQLGDLHPVVTSKPIYSGNQVKLLNQGVRINSALYERIVRHKLSAPLEQSLTAENGVGMGEIAELAAQTLSGSEQFGLIAAVLGDSLDLAGVFRGIDLLEPIAFKLTVAREMRPALLAHSIDVALLAAFLAARSGASADEIRDAAVAGLLHDLGELHLDPEILTRAGQLSEAERRHIYSHPLSAFLSLSGYPAYHPAISTAVLEHHERLDGSGYPRGIRGLEISPLGRILCLAEVVGVLMRASWGVHRAAKIIMVLKVGRQKFDRKLLDHVISLFASVRSVDGGSTSRGEPPEAAAISGAIGRIAAVLLDWEKLYRPRAAREGAGAGDPLLGFVNERVGSLAQVLVEAGFDYHDPGSFASHEGADAGTLDEMALFARESLWQLREIMLEIRRRWREFPAAAPSNRTAVQAWLDRSSDQLAPV